MGNGVNASEYYRGNVPNADSRQILSLKVTSDIAQLKNVSQIDRKEERKYHTVKNPYDVMESEQLLNEEMLKVESLERDVTF